MIFCANCGRQRDRDAQFCGTCGTEYSDSPTPAPATSSQPSASAPAHETTAGDAPRAPADRTDPFASWYRPQEQSGAVGDDRDEHWQPTQTVHSAPQPGYAPPMPPAGPPAQPYPQAQPYPPGQPYPQGQPYPPVPPRAGRNRRGRRGLFIVLAAVVVLAAGGGAYAVANSLGGHTSGSDQSGGTGSAGTPSASASPALSLVSIGPGVASPAAEPPVEDLLSHYFHGINTRDYAEYASTLDPAERAKQSSSVFDSGYATTTDSGMTLTSLADGSDGGLTATVTFTSHQSAAQSVDKSLCNDWKLNLYLVPQGSGYLIGPAPAGYQPAYSNC